MALDFTTELLLYFYEVENPRRPNEYPNADVQMRAPLDIYDFIAVIRTQEKRVEELEIELSEVRWLASRDTDDGSTKYIP